MLTFHVDVHLIRVSGLEPDQQRALTALLSYPDNTKEYHARRYGYPTPLIYLYKDNRFPTGLLRHVEAYLERKGWDYRIKDGTQPLAAQPCDLPDWLYPHQVRAINSAWDKVRGVIRSPTGSGKTMMAAHYLRAFPKSRLLVTVPLLDILGKTAASLESALGEPVGMLSGTKRKWQRVTVGVINTLHSRQDEFAEQLAEVEAVILDECHLAPAERYAAVLARCTNAQRRIGLSATPYNGTGRDLLLEGLLGTTIEHVTEQEVIDSGLIIAPQALFVNVRTTQKFNYTQNRRRTKEGWAYTTYNKKPEREEVYKKALVENSERNELIVKLSKAFIESPCGGSLVVLVSRIEHGQILKQVFTDLGIDLPFIWGEQSKKGRKKRETVIDGLGNTGIRAAIASSILNMAVDIPDLRVVINAGGGGSEGVALQQVGRAVRNAPGKESAFYIDFNDDEPHYLRNNANDRKQAILERYPDAVQNVSLGEAFQRLSNLIA